MKGKRWPFQNYKKGIMIYLITLNKLKNTYCTKAYLHTKFASAKKKNQNQAKKSYMVEMYLVG